jgi:hypothetical protein
MTVSHENSMCGGKSGTVGYKFKVKAVDSIWYRVQSVENSNLCLRHRVQSMAYSFIPSRVSTGHICALDVEL